MGVSDALGCNSSNFWQAGDFNACLYESFAMTLVLFFTWLLTTLAEYFKINRRHQQLQFRELNDYLILFLTFILIVPPIILRATMTNPVIADDISAAGQLIIWIGSFFWTVNATRFNGDTSVFRRLFWAIALCYYIIVFRSAQWYSDTNSQTEVPLKACQLGFAIALFFFGCFFSRGLTIQTRYEQLREPFLSPDGNLSLQQKVDESVRATVISLHGTSDNRPKVQQAMKYSSEERAGFLSRLTFWWLNPLFVTGFKKQLEFEDFEPYTRFDYKTAGKLPRFKAILDAQPKKQKRLFKAIFAVFGWRFLFGGFLKTCYDVLQFIGPVILGDMLSYLEITNTGDRGYKENYWGWVYCGILFASAFFGTFILQRYFHIGFTTGMGIRTAVVSTMFEKAICLTPSARKEFTKGKIMNLVSTDAQRLRDAAPYSWMLISAPLQVTFAFYLLYSKLGWSVFVGVLGTTAISIPYNAGVMKYAQTKQKAIMAIKDERLKVINELFGAITIIKLYAWELAFGKKISEIRARELAKLKKYKVVYSMMWLSWSVLPVITSVVTFSCYTGLAGGTLDADKAFTSIVLFSLLRFPLVMLPRSIMLIVEYNISLGRINRFLEADELPKEKIFLKKIDNIVLGMRNANMFWDDQMEHPAIKDISVTFRRNSLNMVIGRTGSGKSALLLSLSGNLIRNSGDLFGDGSATAFSDQVAWIQHKTLRENILFGKAFNERWYNKVISACALLPDIKILPAGDQTELGEQGVNLSGGQKARIALARAVYSQADVFLLDDVLAAVDAEVAEHIMNNCILGLLKGKCVILATNNLNYLSHADQILCLQEGSMVFRGKLVELQQTKLDLSEFTKGHMSNEVEEAIVEDIAQVPLAKKQSSDVKQNQKKIKDGRLVDEEKREEGRVKSKVYAHYIRAAGGWLTFFAITVTYIAYNCADTGSSLFISFWTDNIDAHSTGWYLGIYVAISMAVLPIMILQYSIRIYGSLKSAAFFHESMLTRLLHAPTSFFDVTPRGRIINRFSKDIYAVDETLPSTSVSFLSQCWKQTFIFGVMISIVPWFGLLFIPLSAMYYMVQRYYLSTSRELKRWSSVLNSPIFSHFGESVEGAKSLRAFGVQSRFQEEIAQLVDRDLAAYYPQITANRWLAIRLEFVGTCTILGVSVFIVFKRGEIMSGLAGLVLANAMTCTQGLNWLVRMSAQMERDIVSVERIGEYEQTIQEAPYLLPAVQPAKWPTEGAITFMNVKLRYRAGLPLVLQGLNFSIRPRERVGVCGRTGSGKSSTFLALMRIVEIEKFEDSGVFIDGVDCTKLGLHTLRNAIAIIPQDPVLFTGTVRMNLDPLSIYSDEMIEQTLSQAHLGGLIKSFEDGINHQVTEDGGNFSVGQRQLLCLARALLRKTKILLLDEATSAVDMHTDALVQKTIRESFQDRTILTIAHRIDTIMDYDRILVLDNGKVAEFDCPNELLKRDSIFRGLVRSAKQQSG